MNTQPISCDDVAAAEITYIEGFDNPSANVVLMGSDKVALRVHDYYLKAASPFFRDMLEAGTKGGPVPLEASSLQLQFIMEKITIGSFRKTTFERLDQETPDVAAVENRYSGLWNLIELHRIAQKYLFEVVSLCIRDVIAGFSGQHGPMALAFACQCNPKDEAIARAALQAFAHPLESHMVDHYFDDVYFHPEDEEEYASPSLENISRSFAMELGADALLAYAKALQGVFGEAMVYSC